MAEEGIVAGGVMDVNTALQEVLKTALIHNGLAHGIREAAKALDKHQDHLYVLASNCDEPVYVKLVEALCAEHQIHLIKVDNNKKLGSRAPVDRPAGRDKLAPNVGHEASEG
ncbi:small ribosomal subunit protein eS12-like [Dasypus novemcinctus]|uniref:small ribosomal subunit protein eS12-like n=1 Tax=Dasypus novemcinctus TaxID=9361 RepID=UPI0039C9739B